MDERYIFACHYLARHRSKIRRVAHVRNDFDLAWQERHEARAEEFGWSWNRSQRAGSGCADARMFGAASGVFAEPVPQALSGGGASDGSFRLSVSTFWTRYA